MSLFELLGIDSGQAKGRKHGLMPEAQTMAQQKLNNIVPDIFVENESVPNDLDKPYQLGYIDFETPDLGKV